MFSDKNCHCNLCRFLPLLNSIISSNKRYLHNRNSHKITLKRCLMNRRSPVSANMLVLWSKLLCSRKQQLLLRSWRLPASEINANNYRLHQMKWITCSLRNFLWGFEFGCLSNDTVGRKKKILFIHENFFGLNSARLK